MLTPEQIRRVEELLKKPGITRREIAAQLGLSYNTFLLRLAASRKRIGRVLLDADADTHADTNPDA